MINFPHWFFFCFVFLKRYVGQCLHSLGKGRRAEGEVLTGCSLTLIVAPKASIWPLLSHTCVVMPLEYPDSLTGTCVRLWTREDWEEPGLPLCYPAPITSLFCLQLPFWSLDICGGFHCSRGPWESSSWEESIVCSPPHCELLLSREKD